jgi:gliding motility-associated lipoprotein GldB
MKKIAGLLLSVIFLWSCNNNESEECAVQPDVSEINLQIEITQFQDSLVNIQSKNDLVRILSHEPVLRDLIFRRNEYPNDSAFINELYRKFRDPHIDTLLQETKRVFGDLSDLTAQFNNAFKNIKYYYPEFQPPKIKTVISGFDADLIVSDTLIVVSLDHYLGKGAKYRPKQYEYILRKYEPEDIVPSCILIFGIQDRLNKTNMKDKTILAEMVAYGKSFYFTKQILPCVPDSTLIWYTAQEIKGAKENEDLIWGRFIQDKILFSTSMIDKRNYLAERPITTQVGEKCPGRIGQWVGWQIVKQYMEANPKTSLNELMNNSDAQKLFKDSGYKPKKR